MRIITGRYKNRPILSPKGLKTRPTSSRLRETLFDICQSYIEGSFFLDLFAGSGAMGLEALSRGAEKVFFVESDPNSIRCIRQNIEAFQAGNEARVIAGDAFLGIKKLMASGNSFEIIYADPPYGTYGSKLLASLANNPILKPSGMLFIEDESGHEDMQEKFEDLTLVSLRRSGRATLQQWQKQL